MDRRLLVLALAACLVAPPAAAGQEVPPAVAVLARADAPFIPGDRLVCFGDSITQFGDGGNGYVGLLRRGFAAGPHPVTVINAGISGNKVPDLQARLQSAVLDRDPTVVFIYIGINDVWHHQGDLGAPKERFEAGLRAIIPALLARGAVVVLATPTVIGEKPDGGNQLDPALDRFAEVGRALAREFAIELCDLRAAFSAHLHEHNAAGAEQGVLTSDRVHLNDAGNALVAREAAASLVAAMRRGGPTPLVRGGDFVDRGTVTVAFRPIEANRGLVARYTLDGAEPSPTSPTYAEPIPLSATTTVRVRAFRGAEPVGVAVSTACAKLVPRPADQPVATEPGLAWAAYDGAFPKLPDVAALTPAASGTAARADLTVAKRAAQYAMRFTGFIAVPTAGVYRFTVTSDDGSRLAIGDQRVVDNDGMHGMTAVAGEIALAAGRHACTLDFHQGGGGQGLELTWSGPGIAEQPIPASAFSRAPTAPTAP
jgi:lysophospholipase L1-like esterase